jgi:hypothetical protein
LAVGRTTAKSITIRVQAPVGAASAAKAPV